MKNIALLILSLFLIDLNSQNKDSSICFSRAANVITIEDKSSSDSGKLKIYKDSIVILSFNTRLVLFYDTSKASKLFLPSVIRRTNGKLTYGYEISQANLDILNHSIYTFTINGKNITAVANLQSESTNTPILFTCRLIFNSKRTRIEIYPSENVIINKKEVYFLEALPKQNYTQVKIYFKNNKKKRYKLKN